MMKFRASKDGDDGGLGVMAIQIRRKRRSRWLSHSSQMLERKDERILSNFI